MHPLQNKLSTLCPLMILIVVLRFVILSRWKIRNQMVRMRGHSTKETSEVARKERMQGETDSAMEAVNVRDDVQTQTIRSEQPDKGL